MKAQKGDRIILAASHTDEPTRDGEVLEVRGANGEPPYLVRWADGHTGLMYPGPGSILRVEGEHEHVPRGKAETPEASSARATAGVVEPTLPHVREWQVRVSIFESGDDTSANVVLLTEAPTHLTARGQSHRGTADPVVPEIGDEVAVARALRHLADQLLDTAAQDVEAVTGEDAHIRPS
ncbi:MAG TPA: dsRBD fold-containing protein [Dermatophilaceae bacterium]|nr:dsRBD fold-containing protein [Dermatophilaceae bacterium]